MNELRLALETWRRKFIQNLFCFVEDYESAFLCILLNENFCLKAKWKPDSFTVLCNYACIEFKLKTTGKRIMLTRKNCSEFFRIWSVTMARFRILTRSNSPILEILTGFLYEFHVSDMILSRKLFICLSFKYLNSSKKHHVKW